MRIPKSYEKDAFTTVIDSLSTTTSDTEDDFPQTEAPFPRNEVHVTIISEIEKRLTQFPHKLLSPVSSSTAADTALVLYRSPESMGLPKLEHQKQEELKIAMRKRILQKRKAEKVVVKDDGYEADAEDWGEDSPPRQGISTNGFQGSYGGHLSGFQGSQGNGYNMDDEDQDEDDEGDMMDLD